MREERGREGERDNTHSDEDLLMNMQAFGIMIDSANKPLGIFVEEPETEERVKALTIGTCLKIATAENSNVIEYAIWLNLALKTLIESKIDIQRSTHQIKMAIRI